MYWNTDLSKKFFWKVLWEVSLSDTLIKAAGFQLKSCTCTMLGNIWVEGPVKKPQVYFTTLQHYTDKESYFLFLTVPFPLDNVFLKDCLLPYLFLSSGFDWGHFFFHLLFRSLPFKGNNKANNYLKMLWLTSTSVKLVTRRRKKKKKGCYIEEQNKERSQKGEKCF